MGVDWDGVNLYNLSRKEILELDAWEVEKLALLVWLEKQNQMQVMNDNLDGHMKYQGAKAQVQYLTTQGTMLQTILRSMTGH